MIINMANLGTGEQVFFVYNHTVLQKEEDDLKDAIIYFHPSSIEEDTQCALCGQLMGMVDYFTRFIGQAPRTFRLNKNKFAIKTVGNISLAFGGLESVADDIIHIQLNALYDLILFYHFSLDAFIMDDLKKEDHPDSPNQIPMQQMSTIWDSFLSLIKCYGDSLASSFNSLPWLPHSRISSLVLMKASCFMQNCQQVPGVIAGSLFYKNKVVYTQLPVEVTSRLMILKPNQTNFPCQPCKTEYEAHAGVKIFRIYLKHQELQSILSPCTVNHNEQRDCAKEMVFCGASITSEFHDDFTNTLTFDEEQFSLSPIQTVFDKDMYTLSTRTLTESQDESASCGIGKNELSAIDSDIKSDSSSPSLTGDLPFVRIDFTTLYEARGLSSDSDLSPKKIPAKHPKEQESTIPLSGSSNLKYEINVISNSNEDQTTTPKHNEHNLKDQFDDYRVLENETIEVKSIFNDSHTTKNSELEKQPSDCDDVSNETGSLHFTKKYTDSIGVENDEKHKQLESQHHLDLLDTEKYSKPLSDGTLKKDGISSEFNGEERIPQRKQMIRNVKKLVTSEKIHHVYNKMLQNTSHDEQALEYLQDKLQSTRHDSPGVALSYNLGHSNYDQHSINDKNSFTQSNKLESQISSSNYGIEEVNRAHFDQDVIDKKMSVYTTPPTSPSMNLRNDARIEEVTKNEKVTDYSSTASIVPVNKNDIGSYTCTNSFSTSLSKNKSIDSPCQLPETKKDPISSSTDQPKLCQCKLDRGTELYGLDLYVQRHSNSLMAFILEKGACLNQETIQSLWQIALTELNYLEVLLKDTDLGISDEDTLAPEYLFMKYCSKKRSLTGNALQSVTSRGNEFCDVISHIHEEFLSDPALVDMTFRTFKCGVYGHRSRCLEAYYQSDLPMQSTQSLTLAQRDSRVCLDVLSRKVLSHDQNITIL